MGVLPDLSDNLAEVPVVLDDLTVTFRLRPIPGPLWTKIWSHGNDLGKAAGADGARRDDVAVPLLTAGVGSFYDSNTNNTPVPWAPATVDLDKQWNPDEAEFGWEPFEDRPATAGARDLWAWPEWARMTVYNAVLAYNLSGVVDPKAVSGKRGSDGG